MLVGCGFDPPVERIFSIKFTHDVGGTITASVYKTAKKQSVTSAKLIWLSSSGRKVFAVRLNLKKM